MAGKLIAAVLVLVVAAFGIREFLDRRAENHIADKLTQIEARLTREGGGIEHGPIEASIIDRDASIADVALVTPSFELRARRVEVAGVELGDDWQPARAAMVHLEDVELLRRMAGSELQASVRDIDLTDVDLDALERMLGRERRWEILDEVSPGPTELHEVTLTAMGVSTTIERLVLERPDGSMADAVGKTFGGTARVTGMRIDAGPDAIPPRLADAFDGLLEARLAETNAGGELSLQADLADLFDLSLHVAGAGLPLVSKDRALLSLGETTLRLVDRGLFDRMVEGGSRPRLADAVVRRLARFVGGDGPRIDAALSSLHRFVLGTGGLEIRLRPNSPVPVPMLALGLAFGAEALAGTLGLEAELLPKDPAN